MAIDGEQTDTNVGLHPVGEENLQRAELLVETRHYIHGLDRRYGRSLFHELLGAEDLGGLDVGVAEVD